MFKSYLKIALRNLIKQKSFSLINIFGLAIGMTVSILIIVYVQDELSYDRFNKNVDRIYRLVLERASQRTGLETTSPPPLAPALMNDFPQIKNSVRFLNMDNPIPLVSSGEKRFYEKSFFFVDPGVFNVFTIPFIHGDPEKSLEKPNTLVITEIAARKYFGDENPLGKYLTLNNHLDMEVTGVVKNPPSNSTLQYDFLVSFSTLYNWLGKNFVDSWQNNMCQTYILLSENYMVESLEQQMPAFIKKNVDKTNSLKQIHFQPLNRVHLYSYQDYRLASGGDIFYIYLLSAIAIFILLIACINFINLTTARYVHRSREVGIRKLAGAVKGQLILQFIGESLFITFIALLIAVCSVELILPYFSTIIGRNLTVDFTRNWGLLMGLSGIVLFISILSSIYPAFFLSSFNPVNVIKGHLKTFSKRGNLRKVLVIVQFTMTITLVIGSLVIYNQLKFMQNKRLGFEGNQVIVVPVRDQNLRQNLEPLKSRLLQQPGIQKVGAASLLPGGPVGKTRYRIQDISEIGSMSMLWVDQDFIHTLGIEITSGRDFSKDYTKDASESFILNEEAVKQLGFSKPGDIIGKSFELIGGKKGTIIGVVKDFHFTSLHRKIEPLVMHIWPWMNYILVRTDAAHIQNVLEDLKRLSSEFDPNNPFTYTFLNENFDKFYQSEKRLGEISGYFTLLAILIACLGLFSLAAFSAERKTKEIGIRKVLGASVSSVLKMQLGESVTLVFIANIIAWPIGYFAMTIWLQNFAYRTEISIGILILAGLSALAIAVATISYHSIKVALTNPKDSLKYE